MKSLKVLTLLIVAVSLFSCGGEEKSEAVEVVKTEPKKEVKKDYDYYMKRIAEDEEWMSRIIVQAEEKGMTVQQALIRNATHMAKKNGFVTEIDESQVKLNKQVQVIKNNTEWLTSVQKNAEEKGVSLDSMLIRTAKFVIRERESK